MLIIAGDVDRYVVRSTSAEGLTVRAPGRVLLVPWARWRSLAGEGALLAPDASEDAIDRAVLLMRSRLPSSGARE